MKKTIYIIMAFLMIISLMACEQAEDNVVDNLLLEDLEDDVILESDNPPNSIITLKNSIIKESNDFFEVNISAPYFEGFPWSDKINENIRGIVVDSFGDAAFESDMLNEFNQELIEDEVEPTVMKGVLELGYSYYLNEDILSLQINIYNYFGGAHGAEYLVPLTMDINTGQVYEFKDLFKDDQPYTERIEDMLIEAIEEDPEIYFSEYKDSIEDKNGDFNFYIDGDEIVVYFDLYDITPYAGGMPSFHLKADELEDILKDHVYNSIKNNQSPELLQIDELDPYYDFILEYFN